MYNTPASELIATAALLPAPFSAKAHRLPSEELRIRWPQTRPHGPPPAAEPGAACPSTASPSLLPSPVRGSGSPPTPHLALLRRLAHVALSRSTEGSGGPSWSFCDPSRHSSWRARGTSSVAVWATQHALGRAPPRPPSGRHWSSPLGFCSSSQHASRPHFAQASQSTTPRCWSLCLAV